MSTMETTLIDEREFVIKYVARIKAMNKNQTAYLNEKTTEAGINLRNYTDGLMTVFCSDKDSLENLFDNFLSIYSNNFSHFVFAYCESIKQSEILRIAKAYLKSKGLEEDFIGYRETVIQQEKIGIKLGDRIIPIGLPENPD